MITSPPSWLNLWRADRETDPPAVARWCQQAGLAFNPFGPEEAELDPCLSKYWVDTFSEKTQGRRATLVLGKPGSGQTAAAMLLAYRCTYPPSSPYESGAFPVYWNPFDRASGLVFRSLEEGLIKAAAATLARYLAEYPAHFASLQKGRKHRIARLLTFWAGSRESVEQTLQAEGPDSGVPDELVRDIARHCPEAAPLGTMRLLEGVWPQGFDALYLILDVSAFPLASLAAPGSQLTAEPLPAQLRREMERRYTTLEEVKTLCLDLGIPYDDLPGEERQGKIREIVSYFDRRGCLSDLVRFVRGQSSAVAVVSVEDLRSLIAMKNHLAGRGIYLKLFLPLALQTADVLGDTADEVSQLTWSDDDLKHMLQARIRAAGKGDMTELCAQDVPSGLDDRLVQAAAGSPRCLVQLGNRLLEAQARLRPRSRCLSAEAIDGVLGPRRSEERR